MLEEVVLHTSLIEHDMGELGHSFGNVIHPSGAYDPCWIVVWTPEGCLTDPIGFANEPVGEAESLERLDRPTHDAVGVPQLQRSLAPFDDAHGDIGEGRQLCSEYEPGRTGAHDQNVGLGGRISRVRVDCGVDVGIAGSETVEMELHRSPVLPGVRPTQPVSPHPPSTSAVSPKSLALSSAPMAKMSCASEFSGTGTVCWCGSAGRPQAVFGRAGFCERLPGRPVCGLFSSRTRSPRASGRWHPDCFRRLGPSR